MSKRLLTFMTMLLLLAVFSAAHAQDGTGFVLTEEQINADFSIASSSTRAISGLDVDVKEDGVHVSFQMTTIQDGTSNTVSIIAVLIGLFDQPHVSDIQLENTRNRSLPVPASLQREATRLLVRSWNDYEAGVIAELPIELAPAQIIMRDGGICDPIRHMGC